MAEKKATAPGEASGGGSPLEEHKALQSVPAATARGLSEAEAKELGKKTVWVVSNRVDDEVVLWERDPRHPGGEAFIGGEAPDYVYKTPAVEAVLYAGTAVE